MQGGKSRVVAGGVAVVISIAAVLIAGETVYEYDSNGRMKTASYASGVTANYKFDPAHNLTGIGRVEDSDGDGLPDYWEMLHFGSLTATDGSGDADGDGLTDWEEFLAATDPIDTNSALLAYRGSMGPTTFTVRWASASNRTYSIHYTTNLLESFSVLVSGISGTPPMNEYPHTVTSHCCFYRVELDSEGGVQ